MTFEIIQQDHDVFIDGPCYDGKKRINNSRPVSKERISISFCGVVHEVNEVDHEAEEDEDHEENNWNGDCKAK
jgi:hypothetical protein